jgi:hypothetical protein
MSARLKIKIHNRFALDLPSHMIAVSTIVDDPLETGGRLRVLRNVRDDPIAHMHQKKRIDEAQFAAGRVWQRHRENAEIGGARGIDPTVEAVDGGRFKEPDISKLSAALKQLKRADAALKDYDIPLVYGVLDRNMTITQIANSRSLTSGRQIVAMMSHFRTALDELARLWGLAMR